MASTTDDPALADQRDRLLADLASLTHELAGVEEHRIQLYARRLALFQRGRALSPLVTQRQLADACGVSEVAVTLALRKSRMQAAAKVGQEVDGEALRS